MKCLWLKGKHNFSLGLSCCIVAWHMKETAACMVSSAVLQSYDKVRDAMSELYKRLRFETPYHTSVRTIAVMWAFADVLLHRLSPLLFPYRDLPTNNQKTSNLVYHDDVSWQEWGSNKPGFLPTPKPDLCIAFKSSAFTSQEAARMTSPYLLSTSYAPSLTLEVKTALQSMVIAERQNANNMISLLQRDFALQKDIGQHKQAERRIRFISTTHDTVLQRWQAWYFVIKDDGNPKWCCCDLGKVDYEDPDSDGFQTARRYNLNLCEYISDTVFKELRKTLAGCDTDPSTHGPELQEEGITADVRSVHLSTPSASTTGDSESKRVKR